MKMVPLPPSCVGEGFMLDVNIRREVVRLLLTWVGAVRAKLTSSCSLCGHLCFQEFAEMTHLSHDLVDQRHRESPRAQNLQAPPP